MKRTPAKPPCSAGYTLTGGKCIRSTLAASECPAGFPPPSGGLCLKRTPAKPPCSAGYTLTGGKCIRSTLAISECPTGYDPPSQGICYKRTPPEYTCTTGTPNDDNECVTTKPATLTYTCPDGTPDQNNQCSTTTPADPTCSEGDWDGTECAHTHTGPTISGLDATGTSVAGTAYTDDFTVKPATSTVLASGDGCALSGTAGSYTLTATRADPGQRTCTITATHTTAATVTATIDFTPAPTPTPTPTPIPTPTAGPLEAPSGLECTWHTDGNERVECTWDAVTGATGGYAVKYEFTLNLRGRTRKFTSERTTTNTEFSAGVNSYITATKFQVAAIGPNGTGPFTAWATAARPGPAPRNLEAECRADARVYVSWDPVTSASQYTATITSTPPPAPAAVSLTSTEHLKPPNPGDRPPASFDFEGQPNWAYAVEVTAEVSGTASLPATASATCVPVAPPAPTGVTATCSNGVLTVGWNTAGTGLAKATAYKPRVFTGDPPTESTNWTANAAGHDTTTATIPAQGEPDLPQTGTFQVKVKATNAAGDGEYSDPVDAACGAPGPTGLTVTCANDTYRGTEVVVRWDLQTGATSYEADLFILAGQGPSQARAGEVAGYDGPLQTFTGSGLSARTFEARVRALKATAWTDWKQATGTCPTITPAAPPPPAPGVRHIAAPDPGCKARAIIGAANPPPQTTEVGFEWAAVDDATKYQYRYSFAPGTSWQTLPVTQGVSGASQRSSPRLVSHTRTGVSFGTGSWLHVKAVNTTDIDNNPGTDDTIESAVASRFCSTPVSANAIPKPARPKVNCPERTSDSLTFTWQAVPGAHNYTVIDRSSVVNTINPGELTRNGNTYNYKVTDLPAQTPYWIMVRSKNSAGASVFAGGKTCTTLPVPPNSPSVTCAASSDGYAVTITWSKYTGASSFVVEVSGRYQVDHPNPPTPTRSTHDVSGAQTIQFIYREARGDFKYIAKLAAVVGQDTTDFSTASAEATCIIGPSKYWVTRGAYNGIMRTVKAEVPNPACQDMTENRLAAIMIAISVHEVLGSSPPRNQASSPMALSRNENVSKFFSHNTRTEYLEAYWSPGVGLWQLDILDYPGLGVNATRLNHAERANTSTTGGPQAAKIIYEFYCRNRLWNPPPKGSSWPWIGSTWAACPSNTCKNTYNNIYNSQDDSLNIHIVGGWNDTDGGVVLRRCRWNNEKPMFCYLYDTAMPEGHMGTGPRPLAHPFISLTDNQTYSERPTRYAIWPKVWPESTNFTRWPTAIVQQGSGTSSTDTKTIFKAVPKDILVRDAISPSPGRISSRGPVGWFDNNVNGKVLKVESCTYLNIDLAVFTCKWVNLNTGATEASTS